MNTEIERKFLVSADTYRQLARESMCIQQAYLNKDAERTVRIRIANQQAWITVKGKSDASGFVRLEW